MIVPLMFWSESSNRWRWVFSLRCWSSSKALAVCSADGNRRRVRVLQKEYVRFKSCENLFMLLQHSKSGFTLNWIPTPTTENFFGIKSKAWTNLVCVCDRVPWCPPRFDGIVCSSGSVGFVPDPLWSNHWPPLVLHHSSLQLGETLPEEFFLANRALGSAFPLEECQWSGPNVPVSWFWSYSMHLFLRVDRKLDLIKGVSLLRALVSETCSELAHEVIINPSQVYSRRHFLPSRFLSQWYQVVPTHEMRRWWAWGTTSSKRGIGSNQSLDTISRSHCGGIFTTEANIDFSFKLWRSPCGVCDVGNVSWFGPENQSKVLQESNSLTIFIFSNKCKHNES